MKKSLAGAVLAASLPFAMQPATAHHAGTAFDPTTALTINGVVSEFRWTNPHTWIYLKVATADGGSDEYHFEGMSVSILARSGWTAQSIRPGDKITVTYAPYKDDRKGGEYRDVTLEEGRVLKWNTL